MYELILLFYYHSEYYNNITRFLYIIKNGSKQNFHLSFTINCWLFMNNFLTKILIYYSIRQESCFNKVIFYIFWMRKDKLLDNN